MHFSLELSYFFLKFITLTLRYSSNLLLHFFTRNTRANTFCGSKRLLKDKFCETSKQALG